MISKNTSMKMVHQLKGFKPDTDVMCSLTTQDLGTQKAF